RTRERRLRHVAFLGRAGEVELLAEREKIPDLVHLHRDDPPLRRSRTTAICLFPPATRRRKLDLDDRRPGLATRRRPVPMPCIYRCHRQPALANASISYAQCRQPSEASNQSRSEI